MGMTLHDLQLHLNQCWIIHETHSLIGTNNFYRAAIPSNILVFNIKYTRSHLLNSSDPTFLMFWWRDEPLVVEPSSHPYGVISPTLWSHLSSTKETSPQAYGVIFPALWDHLSSSMETSPQPYEAISPVIWRHLPSHIEPAYILCLFVGFFSCILHLDLSFLSLHYSLFLTLHSSPLPDPLFLCFPSEKSSPPRDIKKTQYKL